MFTRWISRVVSPTANRSIRLPLTLPTTPQTRGGPPFATRVGARLPMLHLGIGRVRSVEKSTVGVNMLLMLDIHSLDATSTPVS